MGYTGLGIGLDLALIKFKRYWKTPIKFSKYYETYWIAFRKTR